MQIAALGGDVERILQFTHGEAPWGLTVLLGNLTELGYLENGRLGQAKCFNPIQQNIIFQTVLT